MPENDNYLQTSLEAFRSSGVNVELKTKPDTFLKNLKQIEGVIFDWDGVFTDGAKFEGSKSYFSEQDMMGLNMLRFGYYLKHGTILNYTVISGQHNEAAFTAASRDHFNFIITGSANKWPALSEVAEVNKFDPSKMLFVFDDINDLSIAPNALIRVQIAQPQAAIFNKYVEDNNMSDIVITSPNYKLRIMSEFILATLGVYEETINHRVNYDGKYQEYLVAIKKIETAKT